MELGREFKNYATNHIGMSGLELHYWEQFQNSLTPMILEEREMRVTQMSVFDRLLRDRIIWISGAVNDRMSTIVQAQLMFLDNLEKKDITLHVDTGGGSVKSGLSIVDVMNYISSDISTINTGIAASMGSILLGAGTRGKRYSLKNSRVMLHQVSSGTQGTLADMTISLKEAEKYNQKLFSMLGEFCGKNPEQVMADANRDFWMDSQETLDYGLIDGVIESKKNVDKKDSKKKK
jgi:ATP-dependent Clp protease protease subunit